MSKQLKIAMIGHKYIPSNIGGVEVVVEELSTRLVKKGYDVTCYNRSHEHCGNNKKSIYKGVKLVDVKTVHKRGLKTVHKKGLEAFSSSFFATMQALKSDADIVHYHAEGPAYWCWIIKCFSKKKVIVTIHGLDWKRAKWNKFASGIIKKGEKRAVKYADEIIVLSKSAQDYFMKKYGRKTNYIPNGVEIHKAQKPNIIKRKYGLKGDDYILYLARIVPEKCAHLLIEAYKGLKTDKKLVIAGSQDSKEYTERIKALAADNPNIILTGFVDGNEKAELYSNTSVYVLPSDVEGMPLTLLEAMSYNVPVIVSDIPENTEVVGKKAVTFKAGSVKSLKNKLVTVNRPVSSDVLLKYSWDENVAKTISLYELE